MVIIYIFIASIIIFLTLNFKVNIFFEYDVINNEGYFKLKLFDFLFLFAGEFSINQNFIQIKRKNNKFISINLKITKKQLRFFKELNKNIATKIYVKNIELNTFLCFEDPVFISFFSGIFSIITNLFFIKVKQNNYDITIKNNVNTGFRQNMLKVKANAVVYFSLVDIIWAFIITLINSRRIENEERRRKTEC